MATTNNNRVKRTQQKENAVSLAKKSADPELMQLVDDYGLAKTWLKKVLK